MCGHGHAAKGRHLRGSLGQGQIGRADEQRLLLVNHLVVVVHHQLTAKKLGLVLFIGQVPAQHFAKGQRSLHRFKIAQQVHLLAGGDLHAGQQQQPISVAQLLGGGQIARAVMIADGDGVQALELGHAADVGRGHILVAAGRQAGVDMQIGKVLHGVIPYRARRRHACGRRFHSR